MMPHHPVLTATLLRSVKNHFWVAGLWLLVFCISCAGTPAAKTPAAPAPRPQRSAEKPGTPAAPQSESIVEAGETQPVETSRTTPLQRQALQKLRTTSSQKIPAAEPGGKQKIALDFDDADIYEVINALSDVLNINYVIDPAVRGKVNIHTSGEIDKSQLMPIMETIFKINNIAAVKTGTIYKIVPIKEAKSSVPEVGFGTALESMPSADRVIIQIVPLRFIPSAEAIKVMKPFISPGGDIQEYSKGNILIMVDTSANVKKLLSFIDVMDVDAFEQMQVRFFKIKNADVKDMAKELEGLFTSIGFAKSTEKGIGVSFIPIERAGYILAVSSIPGVMEKVEHWVSMLDAVEAGNEEQVFVYFLENAKAADIADVLGNLYGEGAGGKSSSTTPKTKKDTTSRSSQSMSGRNRTSRDQQQQRSSSRKETGTGGGVTGVTGMLQSEIKIVTDETTNSLIVRAIPVDYAVIKETIQKLDVVPKQVLIEVLIAEVNMKGDTEFGVEWALRNPNTHLGGYKGESRTETTYGLGGIGTDLGTALNKGFSYRFGSDRLQAFLVAQASQNKLNILSCPQILAADNKEARIEVGEEVPIVTSEYIPLSTQNVVDQTSRSIEYRNTGVILTVTPRINDKGLVSMDIEQEVSKAQPVVTGGIQSPTITNRKAQTSLVVQNGTTIVIGGLIGQETSKTVAGIPFLSGIPLLGYFFSDTKSSKNKTELIMIITPHVVTNINEAEIISQDFRNKVGQIKKLIRKSDEKWLKAYRIENGEAPPAEKEKD
ncbi:MAG: type II secretion system secretin GspD [Proteobacteria bacterium]|nr:type II secretion system secretin GspD [Pseudomonadota bacterium]